MVVDGLDSRAYTAAGSLLRPLCSVPIGHRVAFIAWRDRKCFAVVDGTEGKPYDNIIHAVAFSSDGKHVAYAAIEGKLLRGC